MQLHKLKESMEFMENENLKRIYNATISDCESPQEIKERLDSIFKDLDNFSERMGIKPYSYYAQNKLWDKLKVEPEYFIYKGFDAKIHMDLKTFKPYLTLNYEGNKFNEKYEIDYELRSELNEVQNKILDEVLEKLNEKTMDLMKRVWPLEKERILKWIKISNIKGIEL